MKIVNIQTTEAVGVEEQKNLLVMEWDGEVLPLDQGWRGMKIARREGR